VQCIMEPSVEHMFSVKAMVLGMQLLVKCWDAKILYGPFKFCLLPSSDVESRSLPTHALAEEIPEDGIFSLNSPFGLGRGCLPVVLNLKYFNNAIHMAHTTYILITNFSKEKILAILLQFAKIFSLQNFVSYGNYSSFLKLPIFTLSSVIYYSYKVTFPTLTTKCLIFKKTADQFLTLISTTNKV